ncbi:MAG TPA: alpha/beta hydrolase, partial [Aquihabitans sp.]|nr:alpha/beta hydrolase [Aquihabitans sp.]
GAATGATSVATVAWLGYDPPDGAVADPGELGAILGDRRARVGGRALTAALDGLALRPRQRLTLVGHSYGSTTVGAALLEGASADNVVVLGSPGVLVDHADDFHRPDADFFALAADDDPVARLGWFGPNPARRGSGFSRLATDASGHSGYLRDGSLSQGKVAAAVLDQVAQGPLDRRPHGGR